MARWPSTFALSAALCADRQPVTIGGVDYLCYASFTGDPDTFVGVRPDNMNVFAVHLLHGIAEPIELVGKPVATSQWLLTADDLLQRATQCNGLTAEAMRNSVRAHIYAGLALQGDLCAQLIEMLGGHQGDTTQLIRQLESSKSDDPVSGRACKACGDALSLLAGITS